MPASSRGHRAREREGPVHAPEFGRPQQLIVAEEPGVFRLAEKALRRAEDDDVRGAREQVGPIALHMPREPLLASDDGPRARAGDVTVVEPERVDEAQR